ncbi:hypothetical protein DENIS_4483 [Desulfonema ishimotonii]|uniref:Uncharacterized protein n=2 Tax=Desulfonema ishimotonii TaxID=45657 RepID=A0A401G2L0_9BACT|nr:hypothetical protein DENIS_4483 [Desulfonema ishimotonii]
MRDSDRPHVQKIAVFQQHNSTESKIAGIRRYGRDLFDIAVFAIDGALPPIIDDSSPYLPQQIHADLVLDFLKHPDLSCDLGDLCTANHIPVVASGKKSRDRHTFTPPT